ncbi:AfsR/SARP family transcriptional regulator [Nonomuraea antri]|uniref:AfsR/SARP family transcriptional regulator n=1 Tax=Nonomuraea antri TaxID=2730852 RepID=UPI002E286DCF|nr:BTAD domain-containing putative transcriptional regulator [Nonomuraea antri]
MEFRVLGPLEVIDDGHRLDLGGGRQQTVLAMLLLDAGKAVTISRLAETIYEDAPPPTYRAQIQICISALRRLFAEHGRPDLIVTQSQAYVARVPTEELDAGRFDALVRQARADRRQGKAEQAVGRYREALALWRGPAVEGMDSRVVSAAARRLNEDRVAAYEDCIELELELGRHHELVGELTALVAEHPLRERLRGLLMLALYRSGRQAEALQAYREARRTMIDELGIEPDERLQRLERSILSSDPALGPPAPPPRAVGEGPSPVPRLLPTDVADFIGRTKQIDEITQRLVVAEEDRAGYAVPIVALAGKPGIGKTTIAVHTAHRVVQHYPDGQLYADLHGGSAQPVSPIRVLERFLRALGVTGTAVPDGLEERAELYRALLADRKVLVVLDDVNSESQVLPLLPGNPESAVILTSRSRLAGLSGAVHVDVDVFDSAQALELLSRIVGVDRVRSEPREAVALAELCGHLPLALRIAGVRLSARPHWSVEQLVDRLEDETRRLDELMHGDMGIRASISLTFDSLSEDARILFRRLAILESEVFSPWLSAALLDRPIDEAQDLLDDLADAQLIETTGPGRGVHTRYRFHDLIRVFARERLAAEEPAAERDSALSRVLGGLLSLVEAARRREHEDRIMFPGVAATWSLPEKAVERLVASPASWFERERSILVSGIKQAAQAGLAEICWGLALGAATFFQSRVYLDDWRETQRIALVAARQAGDLRGEAAMRYCNGALAISEQRFDDARADFGAAIDLFTGLGDEGALASVLAGRGHLDLVAGRLDDAAAHFERALELSCDVGSQSTRIYILHNLAQVHVIRQDHQGAKELLSDAMALVRGGVGGRLKAQVLYRLGQAQLQADEPAQAVETLEEALTAIREIGDPTGEAYILHCTGMAKLRLGELEEAGATLRHALLLAEMTKERLAKARVLAALAELALAEGDPAGAVTAGDQALGLFVSMGVPLDEALILVVLSDAHAGIGDPATAESMLGRAMRLTARMDPQIAGRVLDQLAARGALS